MGRAAPFQLTTEFRLKLVPLIASVNAEPPAVALVGETEAIVGVAGGVGVITKFSAGDDPPELDTVTGIEVALATSVDLICAWSALALRNVVVRVLPFHFTVAPDAKLEPFTVMVKSEAPATTLGGEIEQIAGAFAEETVKPTAGE